MNAHTPFPTPTPEERLAIDVQRSERLMDLEPLVNDLARLGYVNEMLVHSFLDDLEIYASDGKVSVADILVVIEQKREVVYSYVSDVEILTRQLRDAYYSESA